MGSSSLSDIFSLFLIVSSSFVFFFLFLYVVFFVKIGARAGVRKENGKEKELCARFVRLVNMAPRMSIFSKST